MYLMQTVSAVGRPRPATVETSREMDRNPTPAGPPECSLSAEQPLTGYTLGIPTFAPPNYYVTSPTKKFDPTKIPSRIYTEYTKPALPPESQRHAPDPSPSPKNSASVSVTVSSEKVHSGNILVPANIQSYLDNKEPIYQNENSQKIFQLMSPQKFSKSNNVTSKPPEPIKTVPSPAKVTKSSDTSQLVPSSPEVKEEKKKKWTLGGFFRRRKKDSDSDSSSQEEEPRLGFLARRRSRREKRKRSNKAAMGFDHIVKPPEKSDVSKEAPQPADSSLKIKVTSKDSLLGSHEQLSSRSSKQRDSSHSRNSSGGSGSMEGLSRKERLGIIKARAAALRSQKGSSSDEDPNAMDTSLHRMGSMNRRSRFARTERYIKRLSREEESILHREAMEKQRLCKSDAEGPYAVTNRWVSAGQEGSDYDPRYVVTSATPSPGQSPLVRHKNVHYTNSAPVTSVSNPASLDRKTYQSQSVRMPKSYSVRGQSPLPPTCDQKPVPAQRYQSYENFHHPGQRSFSYDNNIHRVTNLGTPPASENVMVVQFPVGRISQFQNRVGDPPGRNPMFVAKPGPPPPPPRDPHRLISSANCLFADSARPMSYAFEEGTHGLHAPYQKQHGSFMSLNNQTAVAPMTVGSRSTSDQVVNSFPRQQTRPRPASVTPEVMKPLPGGRYNLAEPPVKSQFQYYADQTPRSRKPIHIQYHPDQPYLSDSQMVVMKPPQPRNQQVSQATEFWRQKELDNNAMNLRTRRNSGIRLPRSDRSRSPSPHPKDPQESPRFRHRTLIPIRPTDSLSSLSGHSDVSSPMKSDLHDSYESLGGVATDSLRRKDQRPLSMVLESQEHLSLFTESRVPTSPQEVSPKMKFLQDILPNKNKLRPVQENMPMSRAAMDGLPTRTRFTPDKATTVTQKHLPRPVVVLDTKLETKLVETKIPKLTVPGQDYTSTSPQPKAVQNESSPKTPPVLQDTPVGKTVPPVPPVRRFSRQLSSSSLEETPSRKSSNLEDALDELEAIYQSLKLGDEDLLDRAERRDLPTQFQRRDSVQDVFTGLSKGSVSDSGYNYEMPIMEVRRRAPPMRRSGVPDKVMDDMAYRRLNQKERPASQNIISQAGSFLLASPVLSQASSVNQGLDQAHLKASNQEPDTTFDDVVYRNIRHVNNTLKCLDPQPPFGIPVGPVTSSPDSDYLRAQPSQRYRSTFNPRRTPDVVADDLAYRNLRKDKDENFSLRRRRAVRSLSANLPSLIGRDPLTVVDVSLQDRDFEKAQSLTHLPDALEIAQKILEGKEVIGGGSSLLYGAPQLEVSRRPNVDRNSLCTTSTSTETLTDSRANLTLFQDSVNKRNSWQQKLRVNIPNNERPLPPSAPERRNLDDNLLSPASSTNSVQSEVLPLPDAVPGSPLDEAQLEDLLSALAREARVTSAELGLQLAGLERPSDTEPLHIYEPGDLLSETASETHEDDTVVADSLTWQDDNNNNADMTDDSLNLGGDPEDLTESLNQMLCKSRELNRQLPDSVRSKAVDTEQVMVTRKQGEEEDQASARVSSPREDSPATKGDEKHPAQSCTPTQSAHASVVREEVLVSEAREELSAFTPAATEEVKEHPTHISTARDDEHPAYIPAAKEEQPAYIPASTEEEEEQAAYIPATTVHPAYTSTEGETTSSRWLGQNATNVLVACSYCIACTQQMIGLDLDWLTIIGIVLAIVSIIAILMLF